MQKKSFGLVIIIVFLLAFLVAEMGFIAYQRYLDGQNDNPIDSGQSSKPIILPENRDINKISFQKFTSKDEMLNYLDQASDYDTYYYGWRGIPAMPTSQAVNDSFEVRNGVSFDEFGEGVFGVKESVDRYSQTNVQVKGIDEPDIIKTDGHNIYYSQEVYSQYWDGDIFEIDVKMIDPEVGVSEPAIAPDRYQPIKKVDIINALPPTAIEVKSRIEKAGELLLLNNILVVLNNDGLWAYDVNDKSNPIEKWNYVMDKDVYINTARLIGDQLYLVLLDYIDYSSPCPVIPLTRGENKIEIACSDIYRPSIIGPTDVTYSVLSMNMVSGEVNNQVAFVGSSADVNVYVSNDYLYLGYYYMGDLADVMIGMILVNQDLFPGWLINSVKQLAEYGLSQEAKMTEFGVLMEKYMRSLSDDEAMRIENEFTNRADDYLRSHLRELSVTTLVKFDLNNLQLAATGRVPGRLLNQFSLDEYNKNLRVAVTLDGLGNSISENDVYVLDAGLKQLSAVQGLGETERIYSVRFIEDKGYVVTFRETDPFYVLDLRDPKNIKKTGELKIPGYSSYLHPVNKDMILGVGRENSQVKLSLFDVSDPNNPIEKAKYSLAEYWTEVENNHHAFLMDEKHQIFFLPGSNGAYVFSYKENTLSLVATLKDVNVKRAVYINDYLYIVGESGITVFDQSNWGKINEFRFIE